jgi:aspartyl-tRNA(Asn)/glutamyl-tRNA(Gln) amidotransferase subunit C
MTQPLSSDQVRHVARLARLRLSNDQIEQFRAELSSVLDHVASLDEVDVTGVQPLSSPHDLAQRLAEDVIQESLPVETVLRAAPAVEDSFIAVPKVLEDKSGGSQA